MTKQKTSGIWLPVLALAMAAAVWSLFSNGGSGSARAGQLPPSLDGDGTWLNTDSPLSWENLGGKVVWLEFSFIH